MSCVFSAPFAVCFSKHSLLFPVSCFFLSCSNCLRAFTPNQTAACSSSSLSSHLPLVSSSTLWLRVGKTQPWLRVLLLPLSPMTSLMMSPSTQTNHPSLLARTRCRVNNPRQKLFCLIFAFVSFLYIHLKSRRSDGMKCVIVLCLLTLTLSLFLLSLCSRKHILPGDALRAG